MEKNLTEEELLNCALIIDRGLYFYNKLSTEKIKRAINDRNEVSDLAFHIRSLAEITLGISLWFKSIENIFALSNASFIDFNHYLIKGARLVQRQGKDLNPFMEETLESAKDKYYALYFPDGKTQIDTHRRTDEFYEDTVMITSKFIHQDEYSIIGLNKYEQFDGSTIERLAMIAEFWCMDFRNQIVLTNNKFPKLIKHFEDEYFSIPFDFSEIKFNKKT